MGAKHRLVNAGEVIEMNGPVQVIAYDVGTTGIKTCLYKTGTEIKLIDSEMAAHELYIYDKGEAEQDPLEWWKAMGSSTLRAGLICFP